VVFQTFPEATPTKYSEGFAGFTAKSEILPEQYAGPIDLKDSPDRVADFRESTDGFTVAGSFFDVAHAGCHVAHRKAAITARFTSSFLIAEW